MLADPEKIKTVLRNLVDNALKHTPETGPPVDISTRQVDDGLEIVVADHGEGIPAAALPHLFEPFYRPDVSRSRKTGGYGLGLSLCKITRGSRELKKANSPFEIMIERYRENCNKTSAGRVKKK